MGPPQILNLWGSGGIGRPNNDVVVGQCDPIAERDRRLAVGFSVGYLFSEKM